MSAPKASNVFAEALKSLLKSAVKILLISIAWIIRLAGLILSKMGDTIERIVIKRNT